MTVPPGTLVGVTVIAGHADVVNEMVVSPAILSGGSSASSSVIPLPMMRSVQAVANAAADAGCSVNCDAGEAV